MKNRTRHISAFIITVLAGFGCSIPASVDEKEGIPRDHTDDLDGAFHRSGARDPFFFESGCAAVPCHHADLRGGFARTDLDGMPGLELAAAPSCYQCHGKLWEERWPEQIQIWAPSSSVVWRHGSAALLEWWAEPAESWTATLLEGSTVVAELAQRVSAEGVIRIDHVDADWGVGSDYRVRLESADGGTATSRRFSICAPGSGPEVTAPNASTDVVSGQEFVVQWDCASGVVIDAFLQKDGVHIASVRDGAGNTGVLRRTASPSWGTGSGYRIEIVDEEGNVGTGEEFTIRASNDPVG